MFANWAALGANAISLLVSARALGASGRGAYSAVTVWALTSASISDLSLGPALAKAVAIGHPADRLRQFMPRAYLAAALTAVAIMGLVLNVFLWRSTHDERAILIALTIAPGLVLAAWGTYFFQGRGDKTGYALSRMLPPCITVILIVAQALRGLTIDGALAAFSIGYWVVGVGCAVSFVRHRSSTAGAVVGLLGYGIRAHIGTLASIASARLDLLLLTIVVPLAAVGNYSLAVSLTQPIAIVGSGMAAANFRSIGAGSANEPALIKDLWRRFFLPTAALACLAAGAALIVPRFLGRDFHDAVAPTLILAFGAGGLGAIGLATNILQARGLPEISSALLVAAAALSAVTLAILVPRFGIVGAAISSAVTYLVIGASCVPLTLRRSPVIEPIGSTATAAFDRVR